MSNDDDKLLEDYLAGDSELSKRYREETGEEKDVETPPPDVDARLRAAARREVRAGPTRLGRWQAWTAPLATAAVLVLAVGITVLMLKEPGMKQYDAARPPAPTAAQPSAETPARPSARDQGAQEASQPQAERKSVPAMEERLQYRAAPEARIAAPTRQSDQGQPDQAASGAAMGSLQDYRADPTAWLARIRTLLAKGDTQAARDDLARFKKRYPNHPIPDDLASLLHNDQNNQ